ncbi:MAG: hypothetical protein HY290_17405 [Planctomycetia bacterium]|nr:hypothetical protein [Planctomycetia bacterium]
MHYVLAAGGAAALGRLWFLPPLIIIVSLVYSASRYESPGRIVRRAFRLCVQIAGFMAVVLGILAWLSAGL